MGTPFAVSSVLDSAATAVDAAGTAPSLMRPLMVRLSSTIFRRLTSDTEPDVERTRRSATFSSAAPTDERPLDG